MRALTIIILDDVIVHAATEEEHDQRFENVVRVLSSNGLTLNCDKCQFKMSHLEFMGHVLSAHRIGPAEVTCKVKAVVEPCYLKNVAEVRSFLLYSVFYSRPVNSISTLTPTYEEWRTICVGSGTATIV